MKKFKIKVIVMIVFLGFLSAGSANNIKYDSNHGCNDSIKLKNIIEASINIEGFQQFIDAKHRQLSNPAMNLFVLKNDLIKNEISIEKFNLPVYFLSESELESKKIKAFIKFNKIKMKKKTAIVEFEYGFEGVVCNAVFRKKNCTWELVSNTIYEH